MLITLFYFFLKRFIRGNIIQLSKHAVHFLESMHCVSCQLQALSVGSLLPSSQRPASQKEGHLVTFQSSSGRGTHSLHIILPLLFPPCLPLSSPPLSPSRSLYLSSSLFQRPKALMVLHPGSGGRSL